MITIELQDASHDRARLDPNALAERLASLLMTQTDLVPRMERVLGYPLDPKEALEPKIRAEVLRRLEGLRLPSGDAVYVVDRVVEILEWTAVERITDIRKLNPVIAERSAGRSSAKTIHLSTKTTNNHEQR